MKNIQFTQDYRGKLTSEIFYQKDDIGAFEDVIAEALVADGRGKITSSKPRLAVDHNAKKFPAGPDANEKAASKAAKSKTGKTKRAKAVEEAKERLDAEPE